MPDFALETWRIRIQGSADAQHRSRYVFAILTIVSVAISIAGFNAALSWEQLYAEHIVAREQNFEKPQPWEKFDQPTIDVGKFQKQLIDLQLRGWVESQQLHVPLLGVAIGISDLPLLTSMALLVICVWFYYCCRRENHSIHALLRDAQQVHPNEHEFGKKHRDLCAYVFHGITSYLVFITLSNDDVVHQSITTDSPGRRNIIMHLLRDALFFLPPIAIMFIVSCDIYTIMQRPIFRPISAEKSLWLAMPVDQKVHLLFEYLPTVVFAALTTYICVQVARFNRGTREMLRDFFVKCVAGLQT